ncbi:caspase domain protein [Ostertagia ostertagi]
MKKPQALSLPRLCAAFAIALGALSLGGVAHADNHALIMTIDYAGTGNQLPPAGIEADGRLASQIAEGMGVPRSNIRWVRNKELSAQGIADAIRQLANERMQEGDKAFLFYSGHGAQVDGRNGSKCTEGMVSADLKIVADSFLQEALEVLAAKASQVVMLNDSCFSGGQATKSLTRSADGSTPKFAVLPKAGSANDEGYQCGNAVNAKALSRSLGVVASAKSARMLYIAAAADNEADAVLLNFADAESARRTVNRWAADKTAQRIPELLPAGSVTPASRMVLTNALHFKSPWAKPFNPARTTAKPFKTTPDTLRLVPTMSDEREVRMGLIDNVTVMELPFAAPGYALLLAMPPAGRDLQALVDDVDGSELAGWSDQLKPVTCRLELPRINLAPKPQALKAALQALGVDAVFGAGADFSPLLGRSAKGVYLDNVYQSVAVTLDEQGGEAAAATAAVGVAKSFSPPAPVCAVDRPFVFTIVRKPSGAPLFVGRVTDPSQP